MTTAIHAHRCEACAEKGKQVFWIHSDSCATSPQDTPEERLRKTQAHKCPECGTVNWKKALIEPERLPQRKNEQSNFSMETLLGYIVLFAGLTLLGYGIYLYARKRQIANSETGIIGSKSGVSA